MSNGHLSSGLMIPNSTFQVSDGRISVIRKKGERYHPDLVKQTVKFGNGSVMLWGVFGLED